MIIPEDEVFDFCFCCGTFSLLLNIEYIRRKIPRINIKEPTKNKAKKLTDSISMTVLYFLI
jgi:hypothetical protein